LASIWFLDNTGIVQVLAKEAAGTTRRRSMHSSSGSDRPVSTLAFHIRFLVTPTS